MRGADVVGGEDGVEGRVRSGGFYVGSAALFAVYEAEDSDDVHAGFFGGLDGGDGGASGGADVVDDDDVGSELVEAFEAAAGAVGLFGLADEEAVDELVAVVVQVVPGGGAGGVGDERVGSHGESADGLGLGEVLGDEVVEDEAGEAAALGVQGGGAAVDVVVGLLAAGEGEVAETEGVGGDEVQQLDTVVGHGVCVVLPRYLILRKILITNNLLGDLFCKILHSNWLLAKY